jgi:hypothetical protein
MGRRPTGIKAQYSKYSRYRSNVMRLFKTFDAETLLHRRKLAQIRLEVIEELLKEWLG